jgi:hypothetical protein
MTKQEIYKMAQKANLPACHTTHPKALERFAILVAKQQREEDAKLVESMTLEWHDQPEFAQVERTTIQDCALIIRQRVVTHD